MNMILMIILRKGFPWGMTWEGWLKSHHQHPPAVVAAMQNTTLKKTRTVTRRDYSLFLCVNKVKNDMENNTASWGNKNDFWMGGLIRLPNVIHSRKVVASAVGVVRVWMAPSRISIQSTQQRQQKQPQYANPDLISDWRKPCLSESESSFLSFRLARK